MESASWALTFVDARPKNAVPAPVRVKALLKYAGRYLGLRCVADLPLRRKHREECCADLCNDCAAGERAACGADGYWRHPRTKTLCAARQLRQAEQQRRTKDAAEGIAALRALPGDAGRGGDGP